MQRSLIIGADNKFLRLIVIGSNWLDKTIAVGAKERNERQIINDFLDQNNLSWSDFKSLYIFRIPTSKTSVRVAKTILNTVGWYFDLPVKEIEGEEFLNLEKNEILALVADLNT
ncbi:hypothetical protein KC644_00830 [Candidatus Berkelbacteria bacterium]|nr:hypothetical protein [Candidatus Berkelbacteria bacterium]